MKKTLPYIKNKNKNFHEISKKFLDIFGILNLISFHLIYCKNKNAKLNEYDKQWRKTIKKYHP